MKVKGGERSCWVLREEGGNSYAPCCSVSSNCSCVFFFPSMAIFLAPPLGQQLISHLMVLIDLERYQTFLLKLKFGGFSMFSAVHELDQTTMIIFVSSKVFF